MRLSTPKLYQQIFMAIRSKTKTVATFAFLGILFLLSACNSIKDTEPPILRLNGPAFYSQKINTPFVDPGVVAFDLEDLDLTEKVVIQSQVRTDSVGAYLINYAVTDKAGNTSTAQRIVGVNHSLVFMNNSPFQCTSSYDGVPANFTGSIRFQTNDLSWYSMQFLIGNQYVGTLKGRASHFSLSITNDNNFFNYLGDQRSVTGGSGRISPLLDTMWINVELYKNSTAQTSNCDILMTR